MSDFNSIDDNAIERNFSQHIAAHPAADQIRQLRVSRRTPIHFVILGAARQILSRNDCLPSSSIMRQTNEIRSKGDNRSACRRFAPILCF